MGQGTWASQQRQVTGFSFKRKWEGGDIVDNIPEFRIVPINFRYLVGLAPLVLASENCFEDQQSICGRDLLVIPFDKKGNTFLS